MVVPDPGGDRTIAWRTYRACLETPCDTPWLLVLQDDTLVCPDFAESAISALEYASGPVAFFVPTTSVRSKISFWASQKAGHSWCPLHFAEWVPVVALCWPTRLIPGFLEWADARGYHENKWKADDAIVGEWARKTRTQIYATVPCLVEHPDTVPSVSNERINTLRKPRVALSFASEGTAGIDWSIGAPGSAEHDRIPIAV